MQKVQHERPLMLHAVDITSRQSVKYTASH